LKHDNNIDREALYCKNCGCPVEGGHLSVAADLGCRYKMT